MHFVAISLIINKKKLTECLKVYVKEKLNKLLIITLLIIVTYVFVSF